MPIKLLAVAALLALATTAVAGGERQVEFKFPSHPQCDLPLDYRWRDGVVFDKSAGRDPAISFCRAKGFATATFWDIDSRARGRGFRTRYIGSGSMCTDRCITFRTIHCR